MTALYLLAADYRDAAAKLSDLDLDQQTVADTLEGMSGELELKAQSVAHMVRSMEADAAAIRQWAKDAADRAKAVDARAEALREYLARNMLACGISKIEGPRVVLSFRKSSAVVIDEPALLPKEFMVTPPPPPPPAAPSKTLIAEALKSGGEVPGAHLEQRQNLQIR